MERINELFGIKKDPVTGKRYVGKKPGDDQAPDTAGSGTPEEPKGRNFSLGGIDPQSGKLFLGVQPGRDPASSTSGKIANALIPRLDIDSQGKGTGRMYMGTQVGKDPDQSDSALATGSTAKTASAVPQDQKDKTAQPKLSGFGSAFKAARQARLSGKAGDTFEYGGKKYTSYQKGEARMKAESYKESMLAALNEAKAKSLDK